MEAYASFDEIRIDKQNGFFGVTLPIVFRLYDTTAQTAANWSTPFFIANRTYEVISVILRKEVIATNADTVMLKKVPSGTAPASGTDMLTAGMALNGTADTNLSGSTMGVSANRRIVSGDALSFIPTGTLAGLKGVTLSVLLKAI